MRVVSLLPSATEVVYTLGVYIASRGSKAGGRPTEAVREIVQATFARCFHRVDILRNRHDLILRQVFKFLYGGLQHVHKG